MEVSQSLDLCAISGRKSHADAFIVSVYATLLQVERVKPVLKSSASWGDPKPSPARRGVITERSGKSRKRQIDNLAKCRNFVQGMFLTVTYPDEVYFGRDLRPVDTKEHLIALRHRILRRWPSCGYSWALEIVPRRSGKYAGQPAPHYHLLVSNVPETQSEVDEWLHGAWTEIICSAHLPFPTQTKALKVTNRKHAMYYMSKYVTKPFEFGLNIVTSDASDTDRQGAIGRFWGTGGAWDIACQIQVPMTFDQLMTLKRLHRERMRRSNPRYAEKVRQSNPRHGFTVYGWGDLSDDLPDGYLELSEIFKILLWALDT